MIVKTAFVLLTIVSAMNQPVLEHARVHTTYLTTEVREASFNKFQQDIDNGATLFVIDSPGGDVNVMERWMQVINKHPEVTCYVPKYAASAAAIIFMNCKTKIIDKDAEIVFHLSSNCTKTNKLGTECLQWTKDTLANNPELFYRSLKNMATTTPYLTHSERRIIEAGYDLHINGEDMSNRLKYGPLKD